MIGSLNEIETMLRKASVGAGLPVGIAEDIGRAGSWLAAQGYDGVDAVLTAIRAPVSKLVMPVKECGVLVFHTSHSAICGPSAIDLLVAEEAGDGVHLLNVDSPLLIIGLAGTAAVTYGIEINLGFSDGGSASVSPGNSVLSGLIPAPGADIVITIRKAGLKTGQFSPPLGGVVISEEMWHEAEAWAARTYVASTDESRAQGAGAGMTDND